MRELLVRTVSGAVFVALIIACVFMSPWTFAVLSLAIIAIGTFEMYRISQMPNNWQLVLGECLTICAFMLSGLVALGLVPLRFLLIEIPVFMSPFVLALFSKSVSAKSVLSFLYSSLIFLSLPLSLMLFMYDENLIGSMAGAPLLFFVFVLLWMNDVFAYLVGKTFGKHKLFPRISPGKTIEGSLGGLVFTVLAAVLIGRHVEWISIGQAMGMAAIAVIFGTLGDLCESMLKRQAGVKDSGKLIPGHGGILDRFDSVLFSVPFIFVYLLLL